MQKSGKECYKQGNQSLTPHNIRQASKGGGELTKNRNISGTS